MENVPAAGHGITRGHDYNNRHNKSESRKAYAQLQPHILAMRPTSSENYMKTIHAIMICGTIVLCALVVFMGLYFILTV